LAPSAVSKSLWRSSLPILPSSVTEKRAKPMGDSLRTSILREEEGEGGGRGKGEGVGCWTLARAEGSGGGSAPPLVRAGRGRGGQAGGFEN